ncbi:MAG: hypothetical protein JWN84_3408 [Nocardioides sp.]|nr:hypothetical protein [Nocardioides sp.]
MVALITVAVVLVSAGLALWFGHHSLRSGGPSSSGVGNAFGGFDVFDPGQGRMKEDLDSKDTEGEMFAAPDEEDRPVRVDLRTGKIHIRKTPPPD